MVILWVCYGYPMVRTAIGLSNRINNHQFLNESAKLRKINGKNKKMLLFGKKMSIYLHISKVCCNFAGFFV
jgi:hypothetical protein